MDGGCGGGSATWRGSCYSFGANIRNFARRLLLRRRRGRLRNSCLEACADVLTLREATQSVERIDAALFSGDARAQSEVVAELARANPAAFRSMFAEAARVLAGMGQSVANVSVSSDGAAAGPTVHSNSGQAPRKGGEGWGTQQDSGAVQNSSTANQATLENRRRDAGAQMRRPSRDTLRRSSGQASAPRFDPAAYATFERATNDAVARDVRGSIGDTLARVMPEGVAEGAARRIGEDIFNEVHRALAADRALSEQVGGCVARPAIWRGRAAARRGAARGAREAACAQRGAARDRRMDELGAEHVAQRKPRGRRPRRRAWILPRRAGRSIRCRCRQMSAREVNYASMSDEEILGI